MIKTNLKEEFMKKVIVLTSIMVAIAGSAANASVVKINCQGDSQNQRFEIELTKGQSSGHAYVILEDGKQLSGERTIKMGQAGTRLAASRWTANPLRYHFPSLKIKSIF